MAAYLSRTAEGYGKLAFITRLNRISWPALRCGASAGNLNVGNDEGLVTGVGENEDMFDFLALGDIPEIKIFLLETDGRTIYFDRRLSVGGDDHQQGQRKKKQGLFHTQHFHKIKRFRRSNATALQRLAKWRYDQLSNKGTSFFTSFK